LLVVVVVGHGAAQATTASSRGCSLWHWLPAPLGTRLSATDSAQTAPWVAAAVECSPPPPSGRQRGILAIGTATTPATLPLSGVVRRRAIASTVYLAFILLPPCDARRRWPAASRPEIAHARSALVGESPPADAPPDRASDNVPHRIGQRLADLQRSGRPVRHETRTISRSGGCERSAVGLRHQLACRGRLTAPAAAVPNAARPRCREPFNKPWGAS
jgi:hypothetical protein